MTDNFVIAGFSGIIIIVVTVQALKSVLHLKDEQSGIAALVVGVILGLLNYAARVYPSFAPWWEQAVIGFMAGAAAMGGYTFRKVWVNKDQTEKERQKDPNSALTF